MREIGAKGQAFGELWDQYLTSAFFVHRQVWGDMPLGFRAAHRALEALGTERELNTGKLGPDLVAGA